VHKYYANYLINHHNNFIHYFNIVKNKIIQILTILKILKIIQILKIIH